MRVHLVQELVVNVGVSEVIPEEEKNEKFKQNFVKPTVFTPRFL